MRRSCNFYDSYDPCASGDNGASTWLCAVRPAAARARPVRPPSSARRSPLDSVGRSRVYPLRVNAKQPVEKLTISRLARLGGVNLETIRYYEREGLLPRPPRTRSGYRIFPTDTARRLRFIKRAQQLGFSLTEIRELLTLRLKPGTKRDQIRARAEAKISDIEQKIQTLAAMKRALAQLTTQCSGCGPITECPILESLDHDTEVDHG